MGTKPQYVMSCGATLFKTAVKCSLNSSAIAFGTVAFLCLLFFSMLGERYLAHFSYQLS